jgi:hypothetical protein
MKTSATKTMKSSKKTSRNSKNSPRQYHITMAARKLKVNNYLSIEKKVISSGRKLSSFHKWWKCSEYSVSKTRTLFSSKGPVLITSCPQAYSSKEKKPLNRCHQRKNAEYSNSTKIRLNEEAWLEENRLIIHALKYNYAPSLIIAYQIGVLYYYSFY